MDLYFSECKEKELSVAGLNICVFPAIHFLKVHEDSYTFDAHPVYGDFLVHIVLKFSDWRKCFELIRDTPNLYGLKNIWREVRHFLVELGSFPSNE